VPDSIPSSGTPIVWDSIYVPIGGSITDVNITQLTGTHAYISDLRVSLIGPTGVSVDLFTGICGSDENWNIQFDDAGADYFSISCPPTDGSTYHPSENLSSFNGTSPTGWWKLKIEDTYNGDGGKLSAWTINICSDNACLLTTNATTTHQVSCFGGTDGAAMVTAGGGEAPYTYSWSNSGNTASVSSLGAGTYSCTVEDARGCTSTATTTVTQPSSALTSTSSVIHESAGSGNGSIALMPSGGVQPYTYLWDNGQTGQTANGLTAGTYTCTITDANGCILVVTATVNIQVGIQPNGQLVLDVYPNPNLGVFLAAYSLESPDDLTVSVYNPLGQLVWRQRVNHATAGKVEIALGDKPSGVYLVELITDDHILNKKVMVGE
jgi:subtilisin-like proprotein convertase family protein